jgi:hypothetical protein
MLHATTDLLGFGKATKCVGEILQEDCRRWIVGSSAGKRRTGLGLGPVPLPLHARGNEERREKRAECRPYLPNNSQRPLQCLLHV